MKYKIPTIQGFSWQPPVISVESNPPIANKGDRYIIGGNATGAWVGKENQIAWYLADWEYIIPEKGFNVYDLNEGVFKTFNGTDWIIEHYTKDEVDGLLNTLSFDFNNYQWQQPVDEVNATDPSSVLKYEGYRYAIGQGAIGEWTGKDGQIAEWTGTEWKYTEGKAGMVVIVRFNVSPNFQKLFVWNIDTWNRVKEDGVPYTNATANVDLGNYNLTANKLSSSFLTSTTGTITTLNSDLVNTAALNVDGFRIEIDDLGLYSLGSDDISYFKNNIGVLSLDEDGMPLLLFSNKEKLDDLGMIAYDEGNFFFTASDFDTDMMITDANFGFFGNVFLNNVLNNEVNTFDIEAKSLDFGTWDGSSVDIDTYLLSGDTTSSVPAKLNLGSTLMLSNNLMVFDTDDDKLVKIEVGGKGKILGTTYDLQNNVAKYNHHIYPTKDDLHFGDFYGKRYHGVFDDLFCNEFIPVDIDGNLVPKTTSTYNLGSASKYWLNSYLENTFIGNKIEPKADKGADLGSGSKRFNKLYIDELDVANLVKAGNPLPVSAGGTGVSSFTQNNLLMYSGQVITGSPVSIRPSPPAVSIGYTNFYNRFNVYSLGEASSGSSSSMAEGGEGMTIFNDVYNKHYTFNNIVFKHNCEYSGVETTEDIARIRSYRWSRTSKADPQNDELQLSTFNRNTQTWNRGLVLSGVGNLGINTTSSPTEALHVVGNIRNSGTYNNAVSGRNVYVSSTGIFGYLSSSRRFKTDIEELDDTSWLYDLVPVKYKYNESVQGADGNENYGLIAEDVFEIKPELVDLDEDELPVGVKYMDLIAPLINEIKKLKKEVETLSAKMV